MNQLARRLAARIRATGPITLADYMAEALGHPEHGYYRRGDPLGAAGDFTTAPEISQMFGELIGLWLADAWERLGRPDPVRVVELGPGRGTLLVDALRAWCVAPDLLAAADLHLVESSPGLRDRQRAALAGRPATWHPDFGTVPKGALLLVANEFFDALPIRQFQRTEHGWCERMIALGESGQGLRMVLAPPSPAAEALLSPRQRSASRGAIAEVSPAARGLAGAIGVRLAQSPGAALIIDYGHDEDGFGDSLQAVRRHARADPLADPGEADLTAHVDFAALAASAGAAGAQCHGPVDQGLFLRRLGIELRAQGLREKATPAQAADLDAALHRLIDEAEMGSLFRAVAFTSPGFGPPAGFA